MKLYGPASYFRYTVVPPPAQYAPPHQNKSKVYTYKIFLHRICKFVLNNFSSFLNVYTFCWHRMYFLFQRFHDLVVWIGFPLLYYFQSPLFPQIIYCTQTHSNLLKIISRMHEVFHQLLQGSFFEVHILKYVTFCVLYKYQ